MDAPEVDRFHERGVVLALTAAQGDELPEPSRNPGVLDVDGGDPPPPKLQRAWDLLSGRY